MLLRHQERDIGHDVLVFVNGLSTVPFFSISLYALESGTAQTQPYNFPKAFCIRRHIKSPFDDTSDEKSLCFLCVPLCRGAFDATSRGTPKLKNGVPRDEHKMVVVVWAVPYKIRISNYLGDCQRLKGT